MDPSISALPPNAPVRDSDPASPVIERATHPEATFWSTDEGASFGELLDAVNPLHHIPVVSSIYRAVSGDAIGLGPRLIGAAIFGGPLGVIFAGIGALFEEASGGNVVDHALALFEDGDGSGGGGKTAPADTVAANLDHAEGDASVPAPTTAPAPYDTDALAAAPDEPTPLAMVAANLDHAEGDASVPAPTAAPAPYDSDALAASPYEPASPPESPRPAPESGGRQAAAVPPEATAMAAAVAKPGPRALPNHDGDAKDHDFRRIARAMFDSQRAQATLLLANLKGGDAATPRGDGADVDGPHANLRPSGALPTWYADAMQRALDRYQSDRAAPTDAR